LKTVSWNIGKYKGKSGTSEKDKNILAKLEVLEDLLLDELPEIFCVIEGTVNKEDNQLREVFFKNGYYCYYEPSFVKEERFKGLFDFEYFETFGLKIFIKEDFKDKVLPFDPSRAVYKGRLINVELEGESGVFIFLHRNMSSTLKEQSGFISEIYDWSTKGKLGLIAKNLVILGDFNLSPWSSEYFTEKAGYLVSEVIESTYKIKNRNGLCFYNPVIDFMINKKQKNLGGTFHSNSHGWGIYDFALIREYDEAKQIFEIMFETKKFQILDTNDEAKTSNFMNYGFDHLPIKLTLQL